MVIELFNLVVNNKKIIIDNDVVINDELLKTSTIRRLNNVHFNGYLDRLIDDTYELVVQVNGKVRGKIETHTDTTEEEMKEKALQIENVKKHLEGLQIIKVVTIPKKLVSIVAK